MTVRQKMNDDLLTKFVQTIAPNVSPLQGNTIEDDERVSFGALSSTNLDSHIEAAEWTDSIIERCRFDSTTLLNSSFDRVAILDCDLSGVTFSNCLLRECLIVGVRSKFHLSFDNCILDRVIIARSRTDKLEIENSRIVELEFLGFETAQLNFRECQPYKRKGRVSIEDSVISQVSGLEMMGKSGISVDVDAPMWRDLGNHYLKQRGFRQIDANSISKYNLLDDIGEGLMQPR